MSKPTDSSPDSDIRNPHEHSTSRRRPSRGRRLVFWLAGSIAVFAITTVALLTWQSTSPQLSFQVLKLGLITQVHLVSNAVTDQDKIESTLTEQLTPLILTEAFSKPEADLSAVDRMKQQLMIKTFNSILPKILSSARHTKDSATTASTGTQANDYVMKHFLPMALHIQPDTWAQWLEGITAGHFQMGECRFVDNRAACELMIQGPMNQTATLALLWQKDGWLWRLQGLEGLDRLLTAMRETPKSP